MAKTRTCPKCGAGNLKRRSKTYPLVMPGRTINVERVSVFECPSCGHLIPTPEGEAKLSRFLLLAGSVLGKP
jgi:YgiT-type zinc finger domain-containing protein